MIGNIHFIADIIAEKYNVDKRIADVVVGETFKRLKYRINHSEALSIYFPQLGYFVCMNRKLRRYVREYIKKLRKIREKVKTLTIDLERAKSEEVKDAIRVKLEFAIILEKSFTEKLQLALSQLSAIRWIFYKRQEKRKKVLKRKEDELKRIQQTSDESP